jgi:hypothetical protein
MRVLLVGCGPPSVLRQPARTRRHAEHHAIGSWAAGGRALIGHGGAGIARVEAATADGRTSCPSGSCSPARLVRTALPLRSTARAGGPAAPWSRLRRPSDDVYKRLLQAKIAHNLSSWSKLVRSSIDQPVTRSNSLQMA